MTGTGGSGQERKKGDSFPAALTRYLLPYEEENPRDPEAPVRSAGPGAAGPRGPGRPRR